MSLKSLKEKIKSQHGEVATLLTVISLVLMLAGAAAGSFVAKRSVKSPEIYLTEGSEKPAGNCTHGEFYNQCTTTLCPDGKQYVNIPWQCTASNKWPDEPVNPAGECYPGKCVNTKYEPPEETPTKAPSEKRFCLAGRCESNDNGSYKFCYNECVPGKHGYSRPVGCENTDIGWKVGKDQLDTACGTPDGDGTGGEGTECGSKCSQCILDNRTDIIPLFKESGWSVEELSCKNFDGIADKWCKISANDCNTLKTGACASACTRGGNGGQPPTGQTVCKNTYKGYCMPEANCPSYKAVAIVPGNYGCGEDVCCTEPSTPGETECEKEGGECVLQLDDCPIEKHDDDLSKCQNSEPFRPFCCKREKPANTSDCEEKNNKDCVQDESECVTDTKTFSSYGCPDSSPICCKKKPYYKSECEIVTCEGNVKVKKLSKTDHNDSGDKNPITYSIYYSSDDCTKPGLFSLSPPNDLQACALVNFCQDQKEGRYIENNQCVLCVNKSPTRLIEHACLENIFCQGKSAGYQYDSDEKKCYYCDGVKYGDSYGSEASIANCSDSFFSPSPPDEESSPAPSASKSTCKDDNSDNQPCPETYEEDCQIDKKKKCIVNRLCNARTAPDNWCLYFCKEKESGAMVNCWKDQNRLQQYACLNFGAGYHLIFSGCFYCKDNTGIPKYVDMEKCTGPSSTPSTPSPPAAQGLSGTVTVTGNVTSVKSISIYYHYYALSFIPIFWKMVDVYNHVSSSSSSNIEFSWSWEQAENNKNYEIKAVVKSEGREDIQTKVVEAYNNQVNFTINIPEPPSTPEAGGTPLTQADISSLPPADNPMSWPIIVNLSRRGLISDEQRIAWVTEAASYFRPGIQFEYFTPPPGQIIVPGPDETPGIGV